MPSTTLYGITLLALSTVSWGRAIHHGANVSRRPPLPKELFRRDDDPTDFWWVKKLGAIGDSYTAGIGAGIKTGTPSYDRENWACSRYDQSYPMVIRDEIGSSVDKFLYPACSGDRSGGIYDQVKTLDDDMDMIIMTAGGNDLCLASMITKCVVLPFYSEEDCQMIIDKAQENIDTILKPNLIQILDALNNKVRKDGIVVYSGYAQFFNTETDDCEKNQIWWIPAFLKGRTLTIERRKKFNELVVQINQVIQDAIKEVSGRVDYRIGFSNWDPWPIEGVNGQFCDPKSSGYYPDPDQPDLQFFKLNTNIERDHDELRKRHEEIARSFNAEFGEKEKNSSIFDSLLYRSPNPQAEALHKLDLRAPAPPNCPGDDSALGNLLGMPDAFGKIFHPNELGHLTMASFAIAEAIDLRAEVLGLGKQLCETTDQFICWQETGGKGYATADRLDETYKDFCNELDPDDTAYGWKEERTFDQDTPDEHTYVLQLGEKERTFKKNDCLETFERIIHGCDGNDPKNPMNWKFGGKWRRGQHTYELNINRDNRPPLIKEPYGSCEGTWYPFKLLSSYKIKGAGFSSWDWGQKTLLDKARSCVGGGVTSWKFKYYDEPDENGYEWESTFNTPVWVNSRCFKNNKVVFGAKGFTNGCKGSDW